MRHCRSPRVARLEEPLYEHSEALLDGFTEVVSTVMVNAQAHLQPQGYCGSTLCGDACCRPWRSQSPDRTPPGT